METLARVVFIVSCLSKWFGVQRPAARSRVNHAAEAQDSWRAQSDPAKICIHHRRFAREYEPAHPFRRRKNGNDNDRCAKLSAFTRSLRAAACLAIQFRF